MLASKTRSGLSETVPSKTSSATSSDGKSAKVPAKSDSISSISKKTPSATPSDGKLPKVPAKSDSISSSSKKTSPATPKGRKVAKVSSKSDSKSSVSNKTSPATPKDCKLAKVSTKSDSKLSSTGQDSRLSIDRSPRLRQDSSLSIDRSPRMVDLKSSVNKRSQKSTTPPNKQQQPLKGSQLHAQLSLLQEDLKKAREHLASAEKEKAQALAELTELKRLSDEANEKLNEALAAQKKAVESFESEKFRASGLERVGVESAQKREEERQKELEAIRNQHAIDVSALLSTNQELERVKNELSTAYDAKITALGREDNAMKIEKINSEKVELLSGEVSQLKALLDSGLGTLSNDAAELVKQLNCEVDSLKQEIERAKTAEEKLAETEAMIEVLRMEVTNAKQVAADACKLVDEWKKKVEILEIQAQKATLSEKSASGSLLSMMKQLEESNTLLQDAEFEITSFKCNIDALEISLRRHKGDIKESGRHLEMSKQEAVESAKIVKDLKSEIQRTKEEKMQAMDNETLGALNVQSLLEEKNKLINELEASRDEEEKSKKAMESLASALNEVSVEVKTAEEKLSTTQTELGFAESQIEDLKMVLKATEENYEAMLDKAKEEIVHLEKLVERSKIEAENLKATLDEKELEFSIAIKKSEENIVAVKQDMDGLVENSKAEWDEKEFVFVNAMRRSEEEISSIKVNTGRLANLIKEAEEEACSAKEDEAQLRNMLKQVESETSSSKEVTDNANAENLQLQGKLLDKVNELQCITQENNDLRSREAAALKKAEELSKLLEEALTKKMEENSELSSSENEYDLLPKMVEHVGEDGERPDNSELNLFSKRLEKNEEKGPSTDVDPVQLKYQKGNGNYEEDSVDVYIWDSCKIVEDFPHKETKPEPESLEDELDLKIDGPNQMNGLSSDTLKNGGSPPTKPQQPQKKKALMYKFGSLLKKKSNPK
ncbi:WEB family protein, chloroplastic-like protein [Cinnamomum micranthum f. kanehirae]|uniref:WEB family protein, chloroplastic-like protein n=1 Tax=Cinnamomum micranthum f. kanehirae TaxID=337451 RepID=A0A443NR79_9MAGN|nr:WEB family protein, chloroplastic-like protein [Cinnamomum micranthum f. kanehirae]